MAVRYGQLTTKKESAVPFFLEPLSFCTCHDLTPWVPQGISWVEDPEGLKQAISYLRDLKIALGKTQLKLRLIAS